MVSYIPCFPPKNEGSTMGLSPFSPFSKWPGRGGPWLQHGLSGHRLHQFAGRAGDARGGLLRWRWRMGILQEVVG